MHLFGAYNVCVLTPVHAEFPARNSAKQVALSEFNKMKFKDWHTSHNALVPCKCGQVNCLPVSELQAVTRTKSVLLNCLLAAQRRVDAELIRLCEKCNDEAIQQGMDFPHTGQPRFDRNDGFIEQINVSQTSWKAKSMKISTQKTRRQESSW